MNYFNQIEELIKSLGFRVVSKDFERPWGGFLVIDEDQAQDFSNQFFKGINIEELKISGKLSPKILIVNPESRLSWQYHNRRAEIWKVYKGEVGVIRSDDDTQNEMKIYRKGMIDASNKKIVVGNLGDHRVAMCAFILATLTNAKTIINNFETVFTSSPSFLKIMKLLGAKFEIQK